MQNTQVITANSLTNIELKKKKKQMKSQKIAEIFILKLLRELLSISIAVTKGMI